MLVALLQLLAIPTGTEVRLRGKIAKGVQRDSMLDEAARLVHICIQQT